MLEDIQKNIFEKARSYRDAHVYECDNYEEFKERVKAVSYTHLVSHRSCRDADLHGTHPQDYS